MISPMLATAAHAPFDDPDWSWEPKYDGFRLLARIRKPGQVELFSRNRHTFTALYPPIVEALQALPRPAVLDGEAIMLGPDSRASFEAMLALMERRDAGGLPALRRLRLAQCRRDPDHGPSVA